MLDESLLSAANHHLDLWQIQTACARKRSGLFSGKRRAEALEQAKKEGKCGLWVHGTQGPIIHLKMLLRAFRLTRADCR